MRVFKFVFIALLATMAVLACSPEEDDTTQLVINFNALYNNQPLVMNEVVDFDGKAMRINVSEFYISAIELSNGQSTIALNEDDSKYVNFADDQSVLLFDDVPVNLYSKLTFYIGVPSNLNALKPADFNSSQALSRTSTYWENWQSYIFNKLEGKLDTDGDGETDLIFTYHSGTDDLYTKIEITLPNGLDLREGGSNMIDLNVEHSELFKTETGLLDIVAKPATHGPDDLDYQTIILKNYISGVSVK